ncbi:MAG: hypothetical protein WCC17_24295 [Candidatus Nitrosopolaris sp.]
MFGPYQFLTKTGKFFKGYFLWLGDKQLPTHCNFATPLVGDKTIREEYAGRKLFSILYMVLVLSNPISYNSKTNIITSSTDISGSNITHIISVLNQVMRGS